MADLMEFMADWLVEIGVFILDFLVYLIGFIIDFAEGDIIGRPFMMTFAFIVAVAMYLLLNKVSGRGYF